MADNVTIDTLTGSPVAASDDISGVQFQRVKITLGADGVNAGDVASGNPMPIAGTVIVSSSALPTGAALESSLSALNGKVTACNTGAVVVSSSALPSGAATAAKQPALGTAGTASTDVISVQGIASMTPLLVNGSGVTQPVSGTVAFSNSTIAVTNAGTFAVQLSAALPAGTNNIGDVDVLTLPSIPAGSNVIGGVTQSGTWNVATVTTVAAVTAITNALPAGTNAIGKLAANSGVDIGDVDVTSLPALVAGSALVGDVGLQGRATGGLSIFRSIDLDETEEEAKGSAGTLYSIDAMNRTASPLYLKIYDGTAASVTVGTTTPVLTYMLPTNGDTNGCGMVKNIPQGLAFANGITLAVTTGIADNDTGAPSDNAAVVNVGYK